MGEPVDESIDESIDESLVDCQASSDKSEGALPLDRISLREVITPKSLDAAWKTMLHQLRATRFPDFVMIRDPLEWAAAEWSWDIHRESLLSTLLRHRYRPQPAEEMRAAKSKGLSRAMSFLSLDDQLLYSTLVFRIKAQLLSLTEPWTSSGRQDVTDVADDSAKSDAEYSGITKSWWDRWLASQKTIAKILDDCPLIVETDISNFFPSIQLEVLRNRLAVASNLDHDAVELLTYIVSEVGPSRKLMRAVTTGLPVENHDCSRTLAHFFLAEVDNRFKEDGKAGHYTRFVDDVAFGAVSESDAKRKLGRFQDALDRIGLYPNTAKTRWFTREEYESEYRRSENDQLGVIDEQLADGDFKSAQSTLRKFVPTLLATAGTHGRGWDRVLRRVCTTSRIARSEVLIEPLPKLLWKFPGAARHLLEYRSSFVLSDNEATALLTEYCDQRGIYEDIDALIYEYLAIAPVADSTRSAIRANAMQTIKVEFSDRPVVAGAAAVCLSKHSSQTELGAIAEWAEKVVPKAQDTVALRTLMTVLVARRNDLNLAKFAIRRSPNLHRTIEFLEAVASADNTAIQISMNLLKLTEKKKPDRRIARARGLLLLPSVTALREPLWRPISDREKRLYKPQRTTFPDQSMEDRWEWNFE